jgi:hypothetical protein
VGEFVANLRQNVRCEVDKCNEFESSDTSTGLASPAVVLQQITGSPKYSGRRRDLEARTRRGSVNYDLKTARWGVNIQKQLQGMNNDDPNEGYSST